MKKFNYNLIPKILISFPFNQTLSMLPNQVQVVVVTDTSHSVRDALYLSLEWDKYAVFLLSALYFFLFSVQPIRDQIERSMHIR